MSSSSPPFSRQHITPRAPQRLPHMNNYNSHFYENNLQEYLSPESYDSENKWADDDEFYLKLAEECNGRILDLGCGTGRLTRAISKLGREVVCMDIMLPMLNRTKELAVALDIEWIHSDCRDFKLEGKFDLVLMTSHGFQHLLTDEDQTQFFHSVREHLTNQGKLVFDTRNLKNKSYGSNSKMEYKRSVTDSVNRKIHISMASNYDESSQLDHIQFQRVNETTNESLHSEIYLRYTSQSDLNRIIRECGFEVVEQFGNWNQEPFNGNSEEIITICKIH